VYRADMRALAWIALLVSLSACATAKTDRDAASLKDARECEAHADAQLRAVGQEDPAFRLLIFQSCMSLLGWHQGEWTVTTKQISCSCWNEQGFVLIVTFPSV